MSNEENPDATWRPDVTVATIPVGILGIVFEVPVRRLFGSPAPGQGNTGRNGGALYIHGRIASVLTSRERVPGRLPPVTRRAGITPGMS